jgi:hypothetical protein
MREPAAPPSSPAVVVPSPSPPSPVDQPPIQPPRQQEPAPVTIQLSDRTRWYYAEQYDREAELDSFQATFDRKRNKIDVQTHGVTQFTIDTSRIPIDWERLVILGIDGRNSELRRRDFDLLRFRRDKYGQWMVLEP